MNLIRSRPNSLLLVLGLTSLVSGCASTNPYTKFYSSATSGKAASELPDAIVSDGEPEIYTGDSDHPNDDAIRMFENGFRPLGYASFSGPLEDRASVVSRARQLRAAIAIVYISDPHTQTARVNPYAAMGATFAQSLSDQLSGSSTTTPQPRQVSYTSFNQAASFWVKARPPRLGALLRDLTHEEQVYLGGYKGRAVVAVEKGSPAFNADIVPGDIVTRIGDAEIKQEQDLFDALDRYEGNQVDVTLLRPKVGDVAGANYSEKTVRVMLNSREMK